MLPIFTGVWLSMVAFHWIAFSAIPGANILKQVYLYRPNPVGKCNSVLFDVFLPGLLLGIAVGLTTAKRSPRTVFFLCFACSVLWAFSLYLVEPSLATKPR
jgi:hypothetical protein